ncbi:MAG: flagellar protein FlaG [Phenylobacterium sp.]
MKSKVAAFAATPDPTYGQQPPPNPKPEPGQEGPEDAATALDPADLRLIIEEDKASGTYIYKTIDRRTGEVVLQLPREQVLRLREEAEYVAGVVIRTKA